MSNRRDIYLRAHTAKPTEKPRGSRGKLGIESRSGPSAF